MAKNKGNPHLPKSPDERSAYHRYLAHLQGQPTVDDSMDFDPTPQAGEELAEQTSKRKRRIPASQTIGDYVKKNWVSLLIAALLAISSYFMINSRIDIAIIKTNLSYQQQQLEQANTAIENLVNSNHSQDLLIEELQLDIKFLENKLGINP